jgi:hypothetical protein
MTRRSKLDGTDPPDHSHPELLSERPVARQAVGAEATVFVSREEKSRDHSSCKRSQLTDQESPERRSLVNLRGEERPDCEGDGREQREKRDQVE